jgi:cytochrome c peroxidase
LSALAVIGCASDLDEHGDMSQEIQLVDKLAIAEGEELFDTAPEVSNGTACVHCHDPRTGTLNPAQIGELEPDHPLFQNDRRDFDGTFQPLDSFAAFRAHATIMIGIDVPAHVVVDHAPSIRLVAFRRGIPGTINIGIADDLVMQDGRFDSLETQAVEATLGHAEATLTSEEREARRSRIPIFERDSKKRSYSTNSLFSFARGGDSPKLPNMSGRSFFDPGGACAECHGGPALNTVVNGERFADNGSSDANALSNRVFIFTFTNEDQSTTDVVSPDPGRALISGDPADANKFKIPSLFNVVNTAPYFHDNSAATLEEAVSHYAEAGIVELSGEDIEDIVDFLEKL